MTPIPVAILVIIFIVHFFADFVFQTRDMAEKKSSCNLMLLAHVATYIAVLFFATGFLLLLFYSGEAGLGLILFQFALLNGFLHYIVDFFTSRAAKCQLETQQSQIAW